MAIALGDWRMVTADDAVGRGGVATAGGGGADSSGAGGDADGRRERVLPTTRGATPSRTGAALGRSSTLVEMMMGEDESAPAALGGDVAIGVATPSASAPAPDAVEDMVREERRAA
jgi:hypothetical protein